MVGKLLERLYNVCERGHGSIGLAFLFHMLFADDKGVVLAVDHPVSGFKCAVVKESCDIHHAVFRSYFSRLSDLKRLKLLAVSGHKEHIGHSANVNSVVLCLFFGAGNVNYSVKERVTEKPSVCKEPVGKFGSELCAGSFEAAVIPKFFHS